MTLTSTLAAYAPASACTLDATATSNKQSNSADLEPDPVAVIMKIFVTVAIDA